MMLNVNYIKMSKNITIKQFNNNIYEELYPKTSANQIINLIDTIQQSGFTKIETGSYIGTGSYGINNPNSLTFEFIPKLVIIICSQENISPTTMIYLYNSVRGLIIAYSFSYNTPSILNKTLSWYGGSVNEQQNISDYKYIYCAIG